MFPPEEWRRSLIPPVLRVPPFFRAPGSFRQATSWSGGPCSVSMQLGLKFPLCLPSGSLPNASSSWRPLSAVNPPRFSTPRFRTAAVTPASGTDHRHEDVARILITSPLRRRWSSSCFRHAGYQGMHPPSILPRGRHYKRDIFILPHQISSIRGGLSPDFLTSVYEGTSFRVRKMFLNSRPWLGLFDHRHLSSRNGMSRNPSFRLPPPP